MILYSSEFILHLYYENMLQRRKDTLALLPIIKFLFLSIATIYIKEITKLHKRIYMMYIFVSETKTHTIICSDIYIYMYISKIVYFSK